MTETVLTARITAEVASAKAGIQAVQGELEKLKVKSGEAGAAGKTLGPALILPPAVAASTQKEQEALAQLSREIDQLRRSVAPAVTAQELLAQAQQRVDTAIKAGLITQREANVIADQARAKFAGLAGPLQRVEKGAFAAGGGTRMLGQQLSQVFQQGAVTGNYLGALAVQLPDIALGFGGVAIAASIVATVVLPMIITAFGGGKSAAELATEANDDYAKSFSALQSDMAETTALQDEYAAAVKSGNSTVIAAIKQEALIRQKLVELDQLDLAEKSKAAAQADADAQQADQRAQAALDARKAQIDALNAMAPKDYMGGFASAKDEAALLQPFLEAETAEYQKQQVAHERTSLEWQLIGEKIVANQAKLTAVKELAGRIADGTANITGGLNNATGAASGFSGALATAAGYAASIASSINGLNFDHIAKAAELAALKRGLDPASAKNAGITAQSTAQLRPMLDAPTGASDYARSVIQSQANTLATNTADDTALAKWIKEHPVAGSGGSGGGRSGGAGESLAALQTQAKTAMTSLDASIAAINEKVQAGLMSTADAVNAVTSAKGKAADELVDLVVKIDTLGPAGAKGAETIRANMKALAADLKSTGADLATTLSQGFKSPFKDFLTGAKSAHDAMNALGDFVIEKFADMAAEKAVTGFIEPLFNWLFSGVSGGAKLFAAGGVPDAAPLSAHSNTVLDKPTLFPMRGGMGLAGEAGKEAIMPVGDGGVLALWGGREGRLPLVRGANGRLGVAVPDWTQNGMDRAPMDFAKGGIVQGGQASWVGSGSGGGGGGGATNVSVNVMPPAGHSGTVKERMEGGTMHLDVMIEQIEGRLGANMRAGRGALTGAIGETFALARATR